MLYAILCYNDEAAVGAWSKEHDDKIMADLLAVQKPLVETGKMGPVARLMPTTAATTLRKTAGEPVILDGPFAETKEQFLGFYVMDAESLSIAISVIWIWPRRRFRRPRFVPSNPGPRTAPRAILRPG